VQPPPYLDHQAHTPCDPAVVRRWRPTGVRPSPTRPCRCTRPGLAAPAAVERARPSSWGSLLGVGLKQVGSQRAHRSEQPGPSRVGRGALSRGPPPGPSGQRAPGRASIRCATCRPRLFHSPCCPRGRWPGGPGAAGGRPAARNTVLVPSVMAANNEDRGAFSPWPRSAALCRRRDIAFHCDRAQAFGKIPLQPAEAGHRSAQPQRPQESTGPRGSAPWCRSSPEPGPQQHGGGQEGGLAACTPAVSPDRGRRWPRAGYWPTARAAGAALAACATAGGQAAALGGVRLNGSLEARLGPQPQTSSFDGVGWQTALHSLLRRRLR